GKSQPSSVISSDYAKLVDDGGRRRWPDFEVYLPSDAMWRSGRGMNFL
ncbi:unnamed protein product, partial [Brassica rapa]